MLQGGGAGCPRGARGVGARRVVLAVVAALMPGCAGWRGERSMEESEGVRIGDMAPRRGDEIVVAGRYFHTGAPVVLWTDAGGYDAYRTEKRFNDFDKRAWAEGGAIATPNRYGLRGAAALSEDEHDRLRGGGWTLDDLRGRVDQFMIHYDVCGTSRQCFKVLHDLRGLSVHFMLDVDGTIYQTLDVKERAWHGAEANDRSVGVEVAQIGAYRVGAEADKVLSEWYASDERGPYVTLPGWMGDGGVRTSGFVARPARAERVRGTIHGVELEQHDFTPEQYESLARLAATLHVALPAISLDYPRDQGGELITRELTEAELASHAGLVGHYHWTRGKTDPGPAFDWDRVVRRARELVGERALEPGLRHVQRVVPGVADAS